MRRLPLVVLSAALLASCAGLPDNFSVETPQGAAAEKVYQHCMTEGTAAARGDATTDALNLAIRIVRACRPQRDAFEDALLTSNAGMADRKHKAAVFVETYERSYIDRVAAAVVAQRAAR